MRKEYIEDFKKQWESASPAEKKVLNKSRLTLILTNYLHGEAFGMGDSHKLGIMNLASDDPGRISFYEDHFAETLRESKSLGAIQDWFPTSPKSDLDKRLVDFIIVIDHTAVPFQVCSSKKYKRKKETALLDQYPDTDGKHLFPVVAILSRGKRKTHMDLLHEVCQKHKTSSLRIDFTA